MGGERTDHSERKRLAGVGADVDGAARVIRRAAVRVVIVHFGAAHHKELFGPAIAVLALAVQIAVVHQRTPMHHKRGANLHALHIHTHTGTGTMRIVSSETSGWNTNKE